MPELHHSLTELRIVRIRYRKRPPGRIPNVKTSILYPRRQIDRMCNRRIIQTVLLHRIQQGMISRHTFTCLTGHQ